MQRAMISHCVELSFFKSSSAIENEISAPCPQTAAMWSLGLNNFVYSFEDLHRTRGILNLA